jgi:hypothetical protein
MRVLGWLSYDWNGHERHAVSSADVTIDLRDEWVMVSRRGRGTELVAWEWIHALFGWAEVPDISHRLSEPTLTAKKLCDSDHVAATQMPYGHSAYRHRARRPENTGAAKTVPTKEQDRG